MAQLMDYDDIERMVDEERARQADPAWQAEHVRWMRLDWIRTYCSSRVPGSFYLVEMTQDSDALTSHEATQVLYDGGMVLLCGEFEHGNRNAYAVIDAPDMNWHETQALVAMLRGCQEDIPLLVKWLDDSEAKLSVAVRDADNLRKQILAICNDSDLRLAARLARIRALLDPETEEA